MMKSRLLRFVVLPLFAAACAEQPTAPEGALLPKNSQSAAMAIVDGTWTYSENATLVLYQAAGNRSVTFRCVTKGTYVLDQDGASFSGTYVQSGECVGSDGTTIDNSMSGQVVNGSVKGMHVSFDLAEGCRYEGAFTGAGDLVGAGMCGGGHVFGTYRTSWRASR